MPATITIRRRTGSSGAPTNTDITSATTRLSLSDAPTPGTSDPLQIPSSGTNYSFWSSIYLNADTSPTGTIDNVEWYSDGTGSYGTGVTMKVTTAASYTQATGSATTGTQLLIGNYAGITPSPPNNAFGYTSGAPLTVAGSISNPSTGKITDFVVQQLEIASTASPGTLSAETFTITYNET